MTLMLLWQYVEAHPGQSTWCYSQFCENYRRYALRLKRLMRQIHRAGEKMSVSPVQPIANSAGFVHLGAALKLRLASDQVLLVNAGGDGGACFNFKLGKCRRNQCPNCPLVHDHQLVLVQPLTRPHE